ncbi:MAG: hypothetical protein UT69_C0037G0010 [Candidatus Yanofskybacteria bacterium GW2011_GWE1_40_10]|nr:MAG: hypothetical protein UT69_C0037G0010 [Candidatus Yanofskybacteria bacterium GW2011_GWE1_40_10]
MTWGVCKSYRLQTTKRCQHCYSLKKYNRGFLRSKGATALIKAPRFSIKFQSKVGKASHLYGDPHQTGSDGSAVEQVQSIYYRRAVASRLKQSFSSKYNLFPSDIQSNPGELSSASLELAEPTKQEHIQSIYFPAKSHRSSEDSSTSKQSRQNKFHQSYNPSPIFPVKISNLSKGSQFRYRAHQFRRPVRPREAIKAVAGEQS